MVYVPLMQQDMGLDFASSACGPRAKLELLFCLTDPDRFGYFAEVALGHGDEGDNLVVISLTEPAAESAACAAHDGRSVHGLAGIKRAGRALAARAWRGHPHGKAQQRGRRIGGGFILGGHLAKQVALQ
jgi:hypothetical protein